MAGKVPRLTNRPAGPSGIRRGGDSRRRASQVIAIALSCSLVALGSGGVAYAETEVEPLEVKATAAAVETSVQQSAGLTDALPTYQDSESDDSSIEREIDQSTTEDGTDWAVTDAVTSSDTHSLAFPEPSDALDHDGSAKGPVADSPQPSQETTTKAPAAELPKPNAPEPTITESSAQSVSKEAPKNEATPSAKKEATEQTLALASTGNTPNPTLTPQCGANISLMFDQSLSIDSTERTNMLAAGVAFVDELAGSTGYVTLGRFALTATGVG